MLKVAVIGTGYVGLVAGAGLAEVGHRVICVDKDVKKIATLEAGGIPIYEPGLNELVPRNVKAGKLSFTTDLASAVKQAEVVFIAVGTPPGDDGSADLAAVIKVAEQIGDALDGFKVVVVKSTVPIGTCDRVRAIIASRSKEHFAVASNPEFLREGVAVPDFLRPDRIILGIGSDDTKAREVMERLYAPIVHNGARLLVFDVRSSEMTKYASNAMLATRISFMNELANLCERVGADVEAVREGMGSDQRIGPYFLRAGVGYGGSCFPKDIKALLRTGREYTTSMDILAAVEAVNHRQKVRIVSLLQDRFGEDLAGRRIALWGLAFKPATDDMREAPSIPICRELVGKGAQVIAFDPEARETGHAVIGDIITYADDMYAPLEGADALVMITEWSQFASPDWARIKELLKTPVIFDGRNLWEPSVMRELGFEYRGIGRS